MGKRGYWLVWIAWAVLLCACSGAQETAAPEGALPEAGGPAVLAGDPAFLDAAAGKVTLAAQDLDFDGTPEIIVADEASGNRVFSLTRRPAYIGFYLGGLPEVYAGGGQKTILARESEGREGIRTRVLELSLTDKLEGAVRFAQNAFPGAENYLVDTRFVSRDAYLKARRAYFAAMEPVRYPVTQTVFSDPGGNDAHAMERHLKALLGRYESQGAAAPQGTLARLTAQTFPEGRETPGRSLPVEDAVIARFADQIKPQLSRYSVVRASLLDLDLDGEPEAVIASGSAGRTGSARIYALADGRPLGDYYGGVPEAYHDGPKRLFVVRGETDTEIWRQELMMRLTYENGQAHTEILFWAEEQKGADGNWRGQWNAGGRMDLSPAGAGPYQEARERFAVRWLPDSDYAAGWALCAPEELGSALSSSIGAPYAFKNGTLQINSDAGMRAWCAGTGIDRSGVYHVRLGKDVTFIGEYAFSGCENLQTVLTGGETQTSLRRIEAGAFQGCAALKRFDCPDTVSEMGMGVFEGCTSLEWAALPKNLIDLPDRTFYGCAALTKIELPPGLRRVGNAAFSGCAALTCAVLPAELLEIGDSAFAQCYALPAMEIPQGVERMGERVFSACYGLESVTLPKGLEEIPAMSFESCDHLRSFTIPESVKVIERMAFKDCVQLESVALPEGLSEIGLSAFSGCRALKRIEFPPSLEKIGERAFENCGWLYAVSFAGQEAPALDRNAFLGCAIGAAVYCPAGGTGFEAAGLPVRAGESPEQGKGKTAYRMNHFDIILGDGWMPSDYLAREAEEAAGQNWTHPLPISISPAVIRRTGQISAGYAPFDFLLVGTLTAYDDRAPSLDFETIEVRTEDGRLLQTLPCGGGRYDFNHSVYYPEFAMEDINMDGYRDMCLAWSYSIGLSWQIPKTIWLWDEAKGRFVSGETYAWDIYGSPQLNYQKGLIGYYYRYSVVKTSCEVRRARGDSLEFVESIIYDGEGSALYSGITGLKDMVEHTRVTETGTERYLLPEDAQSPFTTPWDAHPEEWVPSKFDQSLTHGAALSAYTGPTLDFTGTWNRTNLRESKAARVKITNQTREGFDFHLTAHGEGRTGRLSGHAYFHSPDLAVYRYNIVEYQYGDSFQHLYFRIMDDGSLEISPETREDAGFPKGVFLEGYYVKGPPVYTGACAGTAPPPGPASREYLRYTLRQMDWIDSESAFPQGALEAAKLEVRIRTGAKETAFVRGSLYDFDGDGKDEAVLLLWAAGEDAKFPSKGKSHFVFVSADGAAQYLTGGFEAEDREIRIAMDSFLLQYPEFTHFMLESSVMNGTSQRHFTVFAVKNGGAVPLFSGPSLEIAEKGVFLTVAGPNGFGEEQLFWDAETQGYRDIGPRKMTAEAFLEIFDPARVTGWDGWADSGGVVPGEADFTPAAIQSVQNYGNRYFRVCFAEGPLRDREGVQYDVVFLRGHDGAWLPYSLPGIYLDLRWDMDGAAFDVDMDLAEQNARG